MGICLFIGHSDVDMAIQSSLQREVERHIAELGVTEFWVDNYGGFSRLAAQVVLAAKKQRPEVKLFLVLPYLPELGRPLPKNIADYDGSIYPESLETVPLKFAISKLNQTMVQKVDYIIAYVAHSWGGAAKTLEKARVRERRGELAITNLAQP